MTGHGFITTDTVAIDPGAVEAWSRSVFPDHTIVFLRSGARVLINIPVQDFTDKMQWISEIPPSPAWEDI